MIGDPLDITVDSGTPADEMRAVADVFDAVGVRAEVRDDYLRLSVDVYPFEVIFIAPLTWVAAAFATGFAQKAGEDAWDEFRAGGWRGLGRFISDIASARGGRNGITTVRDPTGPDVQLWVGIPEQAFEDLANLDWGAMKTVL